MCLEWNSSNDTIGKLKIICVATSEDSFILLYLFTEAYWTVVLDVGDWELWGDCCCRVAACVHQGFLVLPFVHASSCGLVGRQGIQASYDECTALVKSGKVQSHKGTDAVELRKTMRIVSCEQQSDMEIDLLGKQRFQACGWDTVLSQCSALFGADSLSRVLARCLSFSSLSCEWCLSLCK